MSWGVATQNGVSVSLASIVSLSCGATEFSPASLFTSGVQGAWYAPDDLSTLFQDSAGTTPVTAVEQPVGLMLDKSQGLVLGSELVTNGDFSGGTTGWTAGGSAVFSVTGGVATIQNGAAAVGNANQSFTTVVGRWYVATATFSSPAGGSTGGQIYIGNSAGTFGVAFNSVATGTVSLRFAATATTTFISLVAGTATNGASIQVDNVSVQSLAGNHASQATTASRPVLRARYNLLTYSEQFDNAIWTSAASFVTISANAAVAPDGTTTADSVTAVAGLNFHYSRRTAPDTLSGAYTYSVYVKKNTSTWIFFTVNDSAVNYFNLDTGAFGTTPDTCTVVALPNGWYRISATRTLSAAQANCGVGVAASNGGANFTATGTESVYVWGADLRTGSSAGTYQRIAAATDYATAGFLPYLYFITDDSLATGSIDFSATDKMFLCAGLTKSSDSATAILAELSADTNSNNGAFYFAAPLGAAANYTVVSKGTLSTNAGYTNSAVAAPVTNVVAMASAISTDSLSLRVNGTQVATSAGDQGTGNYGNLPLYLGRRGNTSFPLNGNLYQMIVCGKTLSASELASTEAFVATKTGVVI